MKTRILIYGGTNLAPETAEFVKHLTERLLSFAEVSVLSGGFLHYEKHPTRTSVDKAVLEAAERCLKPADFKKRFETWLPSQSLDRRMVRRFSRGRVHELHGSAQARRYRLVQEADAIVTISGKEHTRSILELALALEKPALPMPFTGGDSMTMWKRNREDFLKALHVSPASPIPIEQQPSSKSGRRRLARLAAELLRAAAERRCLVLMPFGGQADTFYKSHIRPAIQESNFIPHRIDKDDYTGDIPTLFHRAVERASATVVDLTGMNPNVLYELGHLHAKKMSPLLLLRRPATARGPSQLPFYLLHEKVCVSPNNRQGWAELANTINDYLGSLLKDENTAPRSPATQTDSR